MGSLWESTPKRIRGDSRNWLQNHIVAWLLAFFLPGGGAVIATLFVSPAIAPKLAALFGFIGGVAGLGLLVGGSFAVQCVLVFRKQRDEARKLYEPIKELGNIKSGDTVKGKDINVSLMFEQLKSDHLSVVTFDHCVLKGPCTIAFEGDSKFHGCNFGSHFPNKLVKTEKDRRYFGVGVFTHCTFEFCEFVNLSFLMAEENVKEFLSKVVQS